MSIQEPDQPSNDFLNENAFKRIKLLLKMNAGINCDGYRDGYLKRRFDVRLRATYCSSYVAYVVYLKKHPEEYQLLLNDIAINFTMFFRDADVYRYLQTRLLPRLLFIGKPVNIWSAGCATGEEPYSLAILVGSLLGNKKKPQVHILASDIDSDALAKARKGEYYNRQLNGLSEAMIRKYFTPNGERFRVCDYIRSFISFEQLDLNKPSMKKNIDLILCRNVMIYFSREGQQNVQANFYDALKDGGYYITGKAEVMTGESCRRFECVDISCRVYRKIPWHPSGLRSSVLNSEINELPLLI